MKTPNNFYNKVRDMVKDTSYNMTLGRDIRDLINSIESKKSKDIIDDKQITIFDDLKNYGNRS